MPAKENPPPTGVWAIASGLTPVDLATWMERAAAATAWTFRLPKCNPAQSLQMLRAMRAQKTWLAVHAHSDWARLCQADAVISGSRSLPAEVLKRELPASMQLGMPDHHQQEAQAARTLSADFVVFSPVWETPSKKGILHARGLDDLARACTNEQPVLALGGIQSPQQVESCRAAGAHGVMVLRAATDSSLLQEMCAAWNDADA